MDTVLCENSERWQTRCGVVCRLTLVLEGTYKDGAEPTLQVALDALKLTPFYNAFEISADVLEIYMQEFWVAVSKHHCSLRFKLNGKSHTVNVDNFRDMLKMCPKLPGQKFDEPPLEEEILSFIRDLRHTGEIKFLSDVNVNHMHQPWRSFATIINKCLSGKTTALESLRLSRAQILWGMYHNKKVDYVYLPWEDLVFQVENKNSKKNNDMYYPRFTKVIVDYFMAKDQAIPRRNNMFWHYARDDFMFTTVRVISKHQDTQVYGTILPQHLTNQAMLESEAYMTYHAYATGEKTPKPKSTKKKADSESSPKTKPTKASKGKRIKTSAKGDKVAKMKQSVTKSKGLTVLYEVALSEADQMKLATKKSKKEFHNSHANGSGDGVDIQSESEEESWTSSQGEYEEENDEHDSENDNDDEDDDQENDNGETESDDDGDNFVHPNLSIYKADDQEKEEEKANDDDEVSSDQMVSTEPGYEMSDEEENQEDDDNVMGGEQEDEDDEELYGDFNLNLDKRDSEMTDAQTNQETEEVHVTLTTEPPVVQQQSSSISSDMMSKFINPSSDTVIDSVLNPNVQSDIPVNVSVSATTETPSSDSIIPQLPILIIQSQQQTHDSTTTTTSPTTTFPEIPNSTSLFGFERRVSSLETELSELKQTNQFAEALSYISGIIDNYLASKMKDAVNVAVQLQSNKLREEAQAENDEFLKQIDSNIKAIIKDQVKAQVSKIMPKVEKYVTESLGAKVFARSSNQPQTSYAATSSLLEFELKKILIDKITENKSMNISDIHKNLYNTLIESYNSDKDLFASYGDVVTLKRGRDDQDKDKEPSRCDHLFQVINNFWDLQDWPLHVQECCGVRIPSGRSIQTTNDQLDWHNPERRLYPHDLSKPLHLIPDARGRLIIPYDHFINNDLEYLKGKSSSRKYTTLITKTKAADYGHIKWIKDKIPRNDKLYKFQEGDFKRLRREDIEDMLLLLDVEAIESLCDDDISKKTPYTAYRNIQGIIYKDDMDKNHLMRTDELHKFSESTLNHVRTSLNDIATGIQMEYLPKRKWTKQDKQRARVMIKAIDKKLKYRRLMRSLEKFVGGRPYRGDLRLLQRTI
ncbi:hypothetical protein Tco_0085266 [Tanacetum coccineum]